MKQSITKAQLVKIHALLNQLGLSDQKREIVSTFSDCGCESSKELSIQEAKRLIQSLSKYDNCDPMRRKVFALAYEANIIWGQSLEDKKMNTIKLNRFLLNNGTVKKEIGKMDYTDLIKTVSQFQQIVKHKEESQAAKETKKLLREMKIESSFKNPQSI